MPLPNDRSIFEPGNNPFIDSSINDDDRNELAEQNRKRAEQEQEEDYIMSLLEADDDNDDFKGSILDRNKKYDDYMKIVRKYEIKKNLVHKKAIIMPFIITIILIIIVGAAFLLAYQMMPDYSTNQDSYSNSQPDNSNANTSNEQQHNGENANTTDGKTPK